MVALRLRTRLAGGRRPELRRLDRVLQPVVVFALSRLAVALVGLAAIWSVRARDRSSLAVVAACDPVSAVMIVVALRKPTKGEPVVAAGDSRSYSR